MSNIYIQEPPTEGKVLMVTSMGDLDIELWSKEAPLACRNFVQLSMEGYYDGLIFHRVVRNFIVQGGDPTGTGEGGDSVYEKPFKDEFHSRLRFVRRGLVAMANAGPNDNGSQFFFTLGPAPELQNKHTIFGKVTGDTIYNLLKIEEVEVDGNERPKSSVTIKKVKVLNDPFGDIIPRLIKKKVKSSFKKEQSKGTKNFKLLSFGDEAEEEEAEVENITRAIKPQKSDSVLGHNDADVGKYTENSDESENEGKKEQKSLESVKERLSKKHKKRSATPEKDKKKHKRSEESEQKNKDDRIAELREEARLLTREIKGKSKKRDNKEMDSKREVEDLVSPAAEIKRTQKQYKQKQKDEIGSKKEGTRQDKTLEKFAKFKATYLGASASGEQAPEGEVGEEGEAAENDTEDEEYLEFLNSGAWMKTKFDCKEETMRRAKDTNTKGEDTFDIYDPRNPMAQRRREESARALKKGRPKKD